MQITVKGEASRTVAPDQIVASVTFREHANSYDEVLQKGVQSVKDYLDFIEANTDFTAADFKTRAYNIHEEFTTNHLDAKTEQDLGKQLTRRVSNGFYFTQQAYLEFDYNRERLAKLLVLTAKAAGKPRFSIDFNLKDPKAYQRGLIGDAYRDAQLKAETLAAAANKHLRDCIHVDLDDTTSNRNFDYGVSYAKSARFEETAASIEKQLQLIDETFHPDDIFISKNINVIWETSD